jgi:hypothetical protein
MLTRIGDDIALDNLDHVAHWSVRSPKHFGVQVFINA